MYYSLYTLVRPLTSKLKVRHGNQYPTCKSFIGWHLPNRLAYVCSGVTQYFCHYGGHMHTLCLRWSSEVAGDEKWRCAAAGGHQIKFASLQQLRMLSPDRKQYSRGMKHDCDCPSQQLMHMLSYYDDCIADVNCEEHWRLWDLSVEYSQPLLNLTMHHACCHGQKLLTCSLHQILQQCGCWLHAQASVFNKCWRSLTQSERTMYATASQSCQATPSILAFEMPIMPASRFGYRTGQTSCTSWLYTTYVYTVCVYCKLSLWRDVSPTTPQNLRHVRAH